MNDHTFIRFSFCQDMLTIAYLIRYAIVNFCIAIQRCIMCVLTVRPRARKWSADV